jgi:L-malate glycosyltransferase
MKNSEKLKIGFLSFYYPHLGGSGIVTTRLAEHLSREGHEIHFIGYDTDENPANMRRAGVRLHKVKPINYPCLKNEPYSISLASTVCNVDEEINLDLIHANYALPHAISAYLARARRSQMGKNLPYVVTGHGSDIHTNGHKDSVNPMLDLALNEADALTYVSNDLKQIAERQLGISKQSKVISNFVDQSEFYVEDSNIREVYNIPPEAFVIGHASNFAPIKQVNHFAQLATYFKGSGELNNIYFMMCGDGSNRSSLESELSRAGVRDHFCFLGIVEKNDIRKVFNASDVVLLTSKHEGNPLTLIESMACGTPVVGSKVGGIEETINNEGGLLFELGNIGNLASQLRLIKENEFVRSKLIEQALTKAKRDYSPDKILEEYLNVFQEVVENARSQN